MSPKPFTPRSFVGMTQGARKRRVRSEYAELCLVPDPALIKAATLATWDESELEAGVQRWAAKRSELRTKYLIGQKLRPCPGCPECDHGKHWRCGNCGTENGICDLILAEVRCKCGKGCGQWRISYPAKTVCDGSGVLPAKRQLCLGCSWCGTPPKEGATRFTECDGSGVLPARRA